MKHEALKIIHEEHRALAALLETLRLLAERLGPAADPRDLSLIRAIFFYIDEFPERLHHAKETSLLFPRLRSRAAEAASVLDALDEQHARGESAIRELEHLLLAYEQLGERRRKPFITALNRYVEFYTGHMAIEDAQVMPLAEKRLTEEDWRELNAAFAENRDPLTGHTPSEEYKALFERIVTMAPAPIGLGQER
ncbi:MAG: hemerythrin domain-containing protein [Quisquiliibacterium sp.]|jgi:hemerythrin-like domain-containing protein